MNEDTKDIRFVSPDKLTTLEEYAVALLSGLISLKTLEGFNIAAFNKGLLDEDESETCKTICWEIKRLLALYHTQINNVLDRTELTERDILDSLKSIMPDVKKSRKKNSNKKEIEDERPS